MLRRVSPRNPPPPIGPGGASSRRFSLDLLFSAVDDPTAVHRSVLRLTYVIAPAVVAISVLARVLGMIAPVWLIVLLASLMMAAAGRQDQLLSRGRFASWMPAAHLNLGLVLLTIWVAKRIRAMVEGLRRPAGTGMSASVGLAAFPDDGLTVRELMEAADLAMYRVKARGGNNVGLAS